MTKGRKKGLRVVSGYQTYTQLVDVYGENLAETMLGNHRTMVALGVGRMGEKLSPLHDTRGLDATPSPRLGPDHIEAFLATRTQMRDRPGLNVE